MERGECAQPLDRFLIAIILAQPRTDGSMFRRLNTVIQGDSVPEVDVEEAGRQLAAGAQLVDVREPVEWAEGHTAGSIHIPLGELTARVGELDTSQPVVTLCRSGNRSRSAVKTLQRSGFPNATSVAGGVVAWTKAGKPLHK